MTLLLSNFWEILYTILRNSVGIYKIVLWTISLTVDKTINFQTDIDNEYLILI